MKFAAHQHLLRSEVIYGSLLPHSRAHISQNCTSSAIAFMRQSINYIPAFVVCFGFACVCDSLDIHCRLYFFCVVCCCSWLWKIVHTCLFGVTKYDDVLPMCARNAHRAPEWKTKKSNQQENTFVIAAIVAMIYETHMFLLSFLCFNFQSNYRWFFVVNANQSTSHGTAHIFFGWRCRSNCMPKYTLEA